jgi:transposase-like protein
MMLRRRREGIAKADGDGKLRGRKPTARAKAEQVWTPAEQGVNKAEIARRLGMHPASVYRILATEAG